MSKYVKNLITQDYRQRFEGIREALLVNVIGLDANADTRLRAELSSKDINVMVVKNSLAARAMAGTPLGPMFDGLTGTAAVCWGCEDVVSLAKEIIGLSEKEDYQAFEPRGGVMDGQRLTPEQVVEVSRWPSRTEQLSILLGQVLAPGANLVSQLTAPASSLADQISQMAEPEEESDS